MQSVSSRIWTRVAGFISYDDNYYTTGTSSGNSIYDIIHQFKNKVAQLTGAVEYTDCFPVEEYDPTTNECPGYDTKHSEALGNAGHPFIAVASRSTLNRSGCTW